MVKVIIISIFLGIGLAMDAAAVSMANGMNEPCMKRKKIITVFLRAIFSVKVWLF